ncbi:hypothetical protein [Tunicatimonas pelagia]|uniref:hypothetical protein n=1 Tax=Tunicatimonas pelagia TaxID=931531 RepID=UPI002665EF7E|nr:hypothetical protein [Tunicatimonas pelagia]WKN45069.1 hypothetical protein P0M28_08835 [Tunicatimonas pelagia]
MKSYIAAIGTVVPKYRMPQSDSLIYVSCTGVYAPSVDIELVQELELSYQVQRTATIFMGCCAAFNALKVADSIVRANAQANVLIVCTELCALHFQSATVLFILKALWQDLTIADNDKSVLSLALGSGLTLESMLLRVAFL